MFVDEVDILVEAGHGGAGCMSFRREKFVPRGGPDGGDGGKGGSVYAVASPHVNTLVAYRFNREFHAKRGGHGQGSNRTGKDAPDIELEVPVGTLIYQKARDPDDAPILIGDLVEAGPARAARPGRHRRPRQRALRQLDQPRATALRSRACPARQSSCSCT